MIKNAIKRFGYLGFIENVLIHGLQKIGISFCVMEVFDLEVSNKTCSNEETNVKILKLTDFENQTYINPVWFTPQKIKEMKKALSLEGNIPVGIVEDKLIIAYGWISLNTFGLEDIVLKEQDGYLWDDYTHPNFRGRGLHSIINKVRISLLRSKGKIRIITKVAHYNRASRIGYLRDGFKIMSRYIQIQMGSLRYSSFKY